MYRDNGNDQCQITPMDRLITDNAKEKAYRQHYNESVVNV
jgi:hypothetical protein